MYDLPTKRFCPVHFTPQMRSKHLNHDVIRLKRAANITVIHTNFILVK